MQENEIITIIMPVYHPGKYLRPCIESLLLQTFRDFRLIAIDDMSPDSSYDILQEYAKKDSRILVLRNPYRLGAARTRNIGIQLAQGMYLSILDADDYYEPDYLATLYSKLDETGADVAICDYYQHDEVSKEEIVISPHPFIQRQLQGTIAPLNINKFFFQAFSTNPFTKMWRRDYVLRKDLLFQDLPNSNDVAFTQIGILAANSLVYISRPLVHYRYHTLFQISATRGRLPLCVYEAVLKIYKYLQRNYLFQDFKISFYTWAVERIVSEILKSDGEVRKNASWFMRQKGFTMLSMTDLSEIDFRNTASYNMWYKFFYQGMFELQNEDLMYQSFFEKMRKRDIVCALWGYGKLGKQFLDKAKKYNFPVYEIYDHDISKWDAQQIPPIKDFSLCDLKVDTIIYTNPKLSTEIARRVQMNRSRIQLIDFSLFRLFNIIGTNEMYVDEIIL